MRWSGIPTSKNFPQFIVICTVKGFGIVNKAEVDFFLKLSWFFDDLTDVGSLISGSSAFYKSRLQQYVNRELPDVQAGFRKAEEPEIKLPTSAESSKKQESSRKTSISALLTMPKPLTVWITISCGKF